MFVSIFVTDDCM